MMFISYNDRGVSIDIKYIYDIHSETNSQFD